MVKIFRHYVPLSLIIKTFFEFCILLLAIPIGYYSALNHSITTINLFLVSLLYACLIISIMSAMGLYNRHLREDIKSSIIRSTMVFSVAFLIMSSIFYSWPELSVSRTTFLFAIVFSVIGISLIRYITFYLVKNDLIYRKKILVYGAGQRANLIGQFKRRADQRYFNCVGFIAIPNEDIKVEDELLITMPDNLFEYVKENNIEEIIVALDDKRKALPIRDLLDCKVYGINILELSTFFEQQTGRIKLQSVHTSTLVFSTGFVRSYFDEILKRLVDLFSAVILFLFTWPLMLFTIIAIKLESGLTGTILYRQIRVGQHNRNFEVFKFRSMSEDAEKNGAQWAQQNDSRVTRVGSFIRKVRIDELPQLFNVIRGEMSFVGPRPERPEFVKDFSNTIQFYEIRHFVKPGITGWAQVCYPYGATDEDTKNKLEFDLYYLKNFSLFLDIMIILQTIQVVLWRQGSR